MLTKTLSGPPIDAATPAQFTGDLPEEADVVIVGGGVIGISAAWALQKMGLSVVVCEKGRIAGEQSSRNWGWVRQTGRDPAELPIMMESISLWQSLAAETADNNLLFSQQGVLYLADNASKIERFDAFIELAKSHGLHSQLLDTSAAQDKIKGYKRTILGGLFTASDGRVEPWGAVPALARACRTVGVTVREDCAVRTIEQTNGCVTGVVTESGTIKTHKVLIAGGAWSSLLARQVGVSLPQLSVTSYVIRIGDAPNLLEGNMADNGLGICKRLDGGYNVALTDYHQFAIGPDAFKYLLPFKQAAKHSLADTDFKLAAPSDSPDSWRTKRRWDANQVSPFENNRVLNPPTQTHVIDKMKQRLHERFDGLESATVTHAWAGMIDTTPDFVPVMDESSLPGLYLATGFSGHGFGIGPGAGKVMANMMAGRNIDHDISRFRFKRFTDKSKLVLGPM